jgi:hypothetical protein
MGKLSAKKFKNEKVPAKFLKSDRIFRSQTVLNFLKGVWGALIYAKDIKKANKLIEV